MEWMKWVLFYLWNGDAESCVRKHTVRLTGNVICFIVDFDDCMAAICCNFVKCNSWYCTDSLTIVILSSQLLKQLIFERCLQIAGNILRLCLAEVFVYRFMQTDPNWSNFLFNKDNRKVNLCCTFATLCFCIILSYVQVMSLLVFFIALCHSLQADIRMIRWLCVIKVTDRFTCSKFVSWERDCVTVEYPEMQMLHGLSSGDERAGGRPKRTCMSKWSCKKCCQTQQVKLKRRMLWTALNGGK